jgi:hypothetical protein
VNVVSILIVVLLFFLKLVFFILQLISLLLRTLSLLLLENGACQFVPLLSHLKCKLVWGG